MSSITVSSTDRHTPIISLTISLSHYLTISLSHYLTVSLSHYDTQFPSRQPRRHRPQARRAWHDARREPQRESALGGRVLSLAGRARMDRLSVADFISLKIDGVNTWQLQRLSSSYAIHLACYRAAPMPPRSCACSRPNALHLAAPACRSRPLLPTSTWRSVRRYRFFLTARWPPKSWLKASAS